MKPAEAYILKQSEPYRSIMMHLQMLIEVTVPDSELLFKWHLPFFYVDKRPICYINQTKGYVDLVFWNAARFTKHTELLVTDKRKRMKSLRYTTLDEIIRFCKFLYNLIPFREKYGHISLEKKLIGQFT